MAENFSILQDLATQEGVMLASRAPGLAVSGNEAPVLVAEDEGDLLRHLEMRAEGQQASGVAQAQVILTAKRPDGSLHYSEQDEFGNTRVTLAGAGTRRTESATAAGTKDVPVPILTLSLTAGKTHEMNRVHVAARQACEFYFFHNDDGAESMIGSTYVGPGDPNDSEIIVERFTAGLTGAQELIVRGTQLTSNQPDTLHAAVELVELP